ncbi:MAG: oxygenase MpaB family protein [Spartobacteria bacterium]
MKTDFSEEPFGPGSMMWKINREVVVLLAGPAAAVLQVAHPMVAEGVARHSRFRTDAVGRLTRTLDAVYTVAFGTKAELGEVREVVARRHHAVRGPGYSAFDPGAQLWVLATLIMGSVTMYERFVAPLTADEKNTFLQENRRFGSAFGLDPGLVWASWPDFLAYWQAMLEGDNLGTTALCEEVARNVIRPEAPLLMRWLSPVFRALTLEMLPPALAQRLGLGRAMLRRPLWAFLDACLPRLLPWLPPAARFSLHYRKALCRSNTQPHESSDRDRSQPRHAAA